MVLILYHKYSKKYKQTSVNQIENVLHTQVEHGINEVCNYIGSFPNRNENATSLPDDYASKVTQETTANMNDDTLTTQTIIGETQSLPLVTTSKYLIPETFEGVKSMLQHWNDEVGAKGESKDTKWRAHLTLAEKKRFTRMRRIVSSYTYQILRDPSSEEAVLRNFEAYYLANKRSF